MEDFLAFWGKASGAVEGGPNFHPAAYHNLDVAAAADALLHANARRLLHMAQLLGTSPENARRVIVAQIALHDIGKFSEAFQFKVPELWPEKLLGPPRFEPDSHHTQIVFDLQAKLDFPILFGRTFEQNWRPSHIRALWAAIAGHHGRPLQEQGNPDVIKGMRSAGLKSALDFARSSAALFGEFEPIARPDATKLAALSWSIAGLTNLADWIGSSRIHFPYHAPNTTLSAYWAYAQKQAATAVLEAGIAATVPSADQSVKRLFPGITTPSPLQAHLAAVTLPEGPVLAIVEDVTGSGKTEAAILFAGRLIAEGRADGLFFALPTMATANAMFDRLGESYRRLFADASQPSLVLAHGRRALHAGFEASILPYARSEKHETQAELTGDASSAVCAAWIADDRRKAFLAHVGVGTVDQAFLAALPVKHQAMRLWGLADRVLIVDEAHAYDAYMGRELERVLEFHAALGGSAIILSATLPAAQREALARAFAKGLAAKLDVQPVSDYPLVTLVSAAGVHVHALATRGDRTRQLPVRAITSADAAVTYLAELVTRGAAVAWIRNSVDDAIEAVEALRAQGLNPALLHARFAMGDRLEIEKRVRETLGRGDRPGRAGFVLVGTQILEQSLDYDVDAMVTDLAPIDLMIQRAGRLWRHTERKCRPVAAPELLVLTPDWSVVEDRNWYRQVSNRAAAVYAHHGIVWRSAKALAEAQCIETPGGVRALIEQVYGIDDLEDVPSVLRKDSQDALGREFAAFSIAGANLLKIEAGYGGNNANWGSDTVTPTRLGDPVTVFRLGKIDGGVIVPWCRSDDGNTRRSWALSEVSLSQRKAVGVPPPDAAMAALIERAKADWPEWEREQPLLVLLLEDEAMRGTVQAKDGGALAVEYDPTLGLRIVNGTNSHE